MACRSEGGGANRPRSALRPRWNRRLSSGTQPHPTAVSDGVALKHCPLEAQPRPCCCGSKEQITSRCFHIAVKGFELKGWISCGVLTLEVGEQSDSARVKVRVARRNQEREGSPAVQIAGLRKC